jgi:hypothetical protein
LMRMHASWVSIFYPFNTVYLGEPEFYSKHVQLME